MPVDDLLNAADRQQIVNAVRDEAGRVTIEAQLHFQAMVCEWSRPSVVYRPRIFMDGDKWCALYGENIQDGVCGFGDSPAKAMEEFDTNWAASLK